MRLPALFLSLLLCISVTTGLQAQSPGAQQDAEAAREKLLNAADQLDNIQANSEATKTSVDGLKTQVTQLQSDVSKLETENATLKQQLADMQTAFDQYKAEQTNARQALIDKVAAMLAEKAGSTKTRKKDEASVISSAPVEKTHTETTAPGLAPPPDPGSSTSSAGTDETAPAPKPQKGYYHVVEKGETLKMICTAYRDDGVNVTIAEIRKANGLTEKSILKPGQKLFIPKPGT